MGFAWLEIRLQFAQLERDIIVNLYRIPLCTMSFKTIRQGNSTEESNTISSVEFLWIYSVESQIGIWTTNNGSVNSFLIFFSPLPKKDSEANKKRNWIKNKVKWLLHTVNAAPSVLIKKGVSTWEIPLNSVFILMEDEQAAK